LGTGEVDFDLTWIASKPLNNRLSVHLNAGYSWLGDRPGEAMHDVVHYGAAVMWQARKRLELVGEVHANTSVGDSAGNVVFGNAGLRWRVFEKLVLDAAAGGRIHGAGPEFLATVGLTWTFGPIKREARGRSAGTRRLGWFDSSRGGWNADVCARN
jgi:hypothetical protein